MSGSRIAVVLVDVVTGLRRIGYTRVGALQALRKLGVSLEEAIEAIEATDEKGVAA